MLFVLSVKKPVQHIGSNRHTKDTGFAVSLGVEHDLWSTIPPCGDIFCQEAGMVMVWVGNSRQTKVTNL